MKISTRGRYALRLMLELALHYGEGTFITLKEVSSQQGISTKYLEQIISPLGKAGLVRSVRGAQGGYQLTRPPQDYTVGEILRLVEGSLAPVPCVENCAPACSRQDGCATLEVWKELKKAIDQVVDSFTLADLAKDYQQKNAGPCQL